MPLHTSHLRVRKFQNSTPEAELHFYGVRVWQHAPGTSVARLTEAVAFKANMDTPAAWAPVPLHFALPGLRCGGRMAPVAPHQDSTTIKAHGSDSWAVDAAPGALVRSHFANDFDSKRFAQRLLVVGPQLERKHSWPRGARQHPVRSVANIFYAPRMVVAQWETRGICPSSLNLARISIVWQRLGHRQALVITRLERNKFGGSRAKAALEHPAPTIAWMPC